MSVGRITALTSTAPAGRAALPIGLAGPASITTGGGDAGCVDAELEGTGIDNTVGELDDTELAEAGGVGGIAEAVADEDELAVGIRTLVTGAG
ncbi:MAG: hypothetical protein U0165_00610 [Polyangiaceae bacterium]